MEFDFTPVESVDKVPEQFRSLYSTTPGEDGKFGIADNLKPVAEAINGFNKSNKQLRNDLKTKAVDLSPLAEFGDSPATIKENIAKAIAEAAGTKGTDVEKKIEGVRAGLAQAHAAELAKRDARAKGLQDQLYSLLVENNATAAVAELKGVPELLLPFIKNQVKVMEEDGQFKVTVIDGAGEVRYGATGSPMTIKELVVEMKANEKYGRLFESEQQQGGGGFPANGARKLPPQQGQQLTSTQKIAAGLNKQNRR